MRVEHIDASSSDARDQILSPSNKIAGGKNFEPRFLPGHCHCRPVRFVYRGSMNQTEEDRYVAKCFSEDCFALSAYHRHPPLPLPLPLILTTPLPAKLHTRVCIYILSKLSAGGVLLRTYYVRSGEMFLFKHDPRENRGGKILKDHGEITSTIIEIMVILFNVFLFFLRLKKIFLSLKKIAKGNFEATFDL